MCNEIKFLLIVLAMVFMTWLNENYPTICLLIIFISFCIAGYLVAQANKRDK